MKNQDQKSGGKTKWNALLFLLIIAFALACTGKHSHDETYTCPMHPTVISDKPGTCPVCGMALVRKSRPGEDTITVDGISKNIKSPSESVISSIKTIKGEFRSVPVSIEAQGKITYDPRNIFTVSSRTEGRIEKLYLKSTYQRVLKGQKIAEIYSPVLLTAQRELLFLLANDAQNKSLIDATKTKVAQLGLSTSQINNLIDSKKVSSTLTIFSPYSGYLITDEIVKTTNDAPLTPVVSEMTDGMEQTSKTTSSSSTTAQPTEAKLIREGNYVLAGQTLFKIISDESLRIEIDLPVAQAESVKQGAHVKLDFGDHHNGYGTIDLIQPFFTNGESFVKFRINIRNTKDLHIGHLVNAEIAVSSDESLWLPRAAVVDLGNSNVVFIKNRNAFSAKKVVAGITTNGMTQVKSGLASADEVAANAQYLIDSESIIRIED